MLDVVLQEIDPVVDLHHEDLVRTQIRQFATGLVDCRQLLLLKDLVGDLADGDDQVSRRLGRADRCGVNLEILVVHAVKRGAAFIAGRQCGMERAEIRSHDLGIVQQFVERHSEWRSRWTARPLQQTMVRPDHAKIRVKQRDTFGHIAEHQPALHHSANFGGLRKTGAAHPDAGHVFFFEQWERVHN